MNFFKQYLVLKTVDLLCRVSEMLGYHLYENLNHREIERLHKEADLDFKGRCRHEFIQENKESP